MPSTLKNFPKYTNKPLLRQWLPDLRACHAVSHGIIISYGGSVRVKLEVGKLLT